MKKLFVISTLTIALMSGAAIAQTASGTGSVGYTNETKPTQPGAENPTAAEVGEAINNAANDVGIAIGNGVNSVVDAVNNTPGAGSEAAADSTYEGGASLDGTVTAAIGEDFGAQLDGYGEVGTRFFADETRSSIASDAEFAAAFNSLTIDQQAELRKTCAGGMAGATEAAFCDAVSRL